MTFSRLHTSGGKEWTFFFLQVVKPHHSYSPLTSDLRPHQPLHSCVLSPLFLFLEINVTVSKTSLYPTEISVLSLNPLCVIDKWLCFYDTLKKISPDREGKNFLFQVLPEDRVGFQRSRIPMNLDRV